MTKNSAPKMTVRASRGTRSLSLSSGDTSPADTAHLWDVMATTIKAPHRRRVMDRGMSRENAEAYVKIAVIRRGVEEEFFSAVPTGSVQDG